MLHEAAGVHALEAALLKYKLEHVTVLLKTAPRAENKIQIPY